MALRRESCSGDIQALGITCNERHPWTRERSRSAPACAVSRGVAGLIYEEGKTICDNRRRMALDTVLILRRTEQFLFEQRRVRPLHGEAGTRSSEKVSPLRGGL